MPLPMRSRFLYGDTGDFTTSLPARAWTPLDETIGGVRVAASGVPATYIVRRDSMLELTLRFEEEEWTDFLPVVVFGQSGQSFLWFPDANEATSFLVYLHAMAPGDRWGPTRDGSYQRMFEVTLTLRGVGDVTPWTPYFAEAEES